MASAAGSQIPALADELERYICEALAISRPTAVLRRMKINQMANNANTNSGEVRSPAPCQGTECMHVHGVGSAALTARATVRQHGQPCMGSLVDRPGLLLWCTIHAPQRSPLANVAVVDVRCPALSLLTD